MSDNNDCLPRDRRDEIPRERCMSEVWPSQRSLDSSLTSVALVNNADAHRYSRVHITVRNSFAIRLHRRLR